MIRGILDPLDARACVEVALVLGGAIVVLLACVMFAFWLFG